MLLGHFRLMGFSIAHMYKCRKIARQVEFGVQPDAGLGAAKVGQANKPRHKSIVVVSKAYSGFLKRKPWERGKDNIC